MFLKYSRFIQPLGFALLLVHFIVMGNIAFMGFFWAGILFTLAGTALEIYFYSRTRKSRRTQVAWVFSAGIISKLSLVAAIVLRVYEFPYSIFILLGCIVLSFIWFFLSQMVKPTKENSEEFLDVE